MLERDPYMTVEAAALLLGVDIRTVYRRITEEQWGVRPSHEKSDNGKPKAEVAVASLPPDAQAKYWHRELQPATATSAAGGCNLAERPAGARGEALRRLPIVLAAKAILDAGTQVSARLAALAQAHGEGRSTLYRWLTAFRRQGFPGLLPGWGKLRGRSTALDAVLQEFCKQEYLSDQQPSVTTVARRAARLCADLRRPAPSSATVARFLRTLPEPAVVLAREGPKAWRVHAEPKIHRDYGDLAVGEIWVGDHRELDVFVRMTADPGAKIFRPWFTAWQDLRSRACVGWHVDLVPNSDTIALALRAGILVFGVPRELYKDNGKDYRCHYLNGHSTVSKAVGFSPAMQAALAPGVLSRLGIASRSATPYTPWAKAIESWFGHTFPEWERTLPGWCGADNKHRPEKLAGEIQRGELLTLEQFTAQVAARIQGVNQREHSVLGCAPLSLWQGVTREIPEARALDLLLLRHKPCKVTDQGIKIFGRYYWSDDLVLHQGHWVDVRYDHQDLGRLVIFGVEGESKGRFLCEAINRPAYSMHASHADLKALHQLKRKARQAALAYIEDRRVLHNEEQVLADLAAQRRAKKVVTLPTPPTPGAPAGSPARRVLVGTELAAARLRARQAAPRRAVHSDAAATDDRRALYRSILED